MRNPVTSLVAARIRGDLMSSRLLTFRELKAEKGWPHSRQYTAKLVKDGKIPAPRKRPGGGAINVWIEREWDQFQSTFASDRTLTAMLIDVLAANSVDAIVAGVAKLRTAIEREGAVASDIIVMLKERPAAANQAAREVPTVSDTS
jgi:hypothetical protein